MEDYHDDRCPDCGRYVSIDDGYYTWFGGDFIELFCGRPCVDSYRAKGHVETDGDGVPYAHPEAA